MYNAEQKSRFVKSFTDSVSVRSEAQKLFDMLEPYEERHGGDLCTMTGEEILHAVSGRVGVRNRSAILVMKILREYGKWCKEQGIPGSTDALQDMRDAGVERMRNTTLRNPRHLQSWLDAICLPESAMTTDNAVRVYCWLGYAGFSAEEAITVRSGEVDFRKQLILHNGREYPIYRESLPAMHNCAELDSFIRKRIPGDILVRGVRSEQTVVALRVELTRKKKLLAGTPEEGMDISYRRIWLSGLFYRMYEDEQAGLPVDFLAAADAQLYDLPARSTRAGAVKNSKRNELAREYQINYERWKQTLVI